MTDKICTNCGERVDASANFCPSCKSTSFRPVGNVAKPNVQPNIIQSLFYWQYDGQFILAKSKLAGIFTFVILTIASVVSPFFAGGFVVSLIFSLIVFLVGLLFHIIKGKPSKVVLDNSDNGFGSDVKNILFYWQNKKTGEYVLSKTKIFTIVIFLLLCISISRVSFTTVWACVVVSLILSIPVFLVGFAIHKLTNPNPTNNKIATKKTKLKVESPKKPVIESTNTPEVKISEFERYEVELERLKEVYTKKDSHARELIEKKFTPPQMTYNKFISVVDSSTKLFNSEADNISSIISLASEDSPRIQDEISSKFEILNSLIDKMDDLINELILSLDSTKDDDVNGLLGDMEDLIGTIKDYE